MSKALTAQSVEKIKPGKSRREIADALLPGLYLVVQTTGVKSYAVRYRLKGKTCKHTLGSADVLGLEDAREQGRDALKMVQRGDDPALQKKLARLAPEISDAVGDVLVRFIQEYHRPKNKSWRQSALALGFDADPKDASRLVPTGKGLAKRWKGRTIGSITKRDVRALLDDAIKAGHPTKANRALDMVRKLFGWCRELDITEADPCKDISDPSPEHSRERALSDAELSLAWSASDQLGWPFREFFRLLVLTGQRRDNVARIRRSELDLDAKTWTIPASQTKNKKDHDVPLSDAALAIIASLPRIKGKADFVITTNGDTPISGYSRAKRRLDKAIKDAHGKALPGWTFHDVRRTAATGLQRLGVRLEVTEAILGHVSGSRAGIVGVYQRHDWKDEKRAALDAWARHVAAVIGGKRENVVPFRNPSVG